MMPPSTTFAAEAKDSALLNRHSSSLHRRVHPSHCFFISSHFPRDRCPHVDTPGAEKERRACEKRIRPTPARRCGWMDGAVGGQAARRDASPHHATARGGRRWKASPDGRTVCVRKEPTRIRFTRRAARRTEAIKPPPRKRGRFSQLCHNAEEPRDEPAKHAPSGSACALPPSRRAESAVHGVSSVEMIPHSPAQNKRGVWGVEVLRAV